MEFITQMLWPGSVIKLFGSYAYGIDLPSGDIDMCLVDTPSVDVNGDALGEIAILKKLALNLGKLKPFVKCVQIVRGERIPVVKIILIKDDIHCDICVDCPAVLKNVNLIRG